MSNSAETVHHHASALRFPLEIRGEGETLFGLNCHPDCYWFQKYYLVAQRDVQVAVRST